MQRVLITGSAGYIGSIIAMHLLELGFEIVGVDDCRTGFLEPMKLLEEKFKSKFKFYKNSINKNLLRKIFANEPTVDTVIHLAASSKVDESVNNPKLYEENNVDKSRILLDEMRKVGVKNLIFASSAAVYGEAKFVPITESHPLLPANPYGESKLRVEQMILEQEKYGLRSIIFRFFNVCGASADGRWGDSRQPPSALVQNVVRGALGISPFSISCSKVPTPDGTTIRDYVDVTDLAEACLLAIRRLRNQESTGTEIFNLGTGEGKSIKEIVSLVDSILGTSTKPTQLTETRKGEVSEVYADIKCARAILGWRPKRKFPDSVKSLISWYKSKPAGWSY